ncbi:MAG: RNA polymerase sigma factor, partial [Solirubrobacteraceae bacterium]
MQIPDSANIASDHTRAYVRSIAMKYVHNDADADDVTQDAMLLAYRYRNAFRGDSRYSTWLYRVTATAALMFLRKQRRLAREIPASGTGTVDEEGSSWLDRVPAPTD